MRIYTTPRTTAAPYDRNPTTKAINGGTFASAPHGLTQRWIYTVPANRKFVMTAWFLRQHRDTVAAPASELRASIEVSPLGAGFFPIQDLETIQNAIADHQESNVSGAVHLVATDVLRGTDSDISTGGTTTQNTGHIGTEFDA